MTQLFAIRVRLLLAFALVTASLAHAQTPVATGAAGGTSFSMIRTSAGVLWAVGHNSQGQLGDNTTTLRRVPQIVSLPAIVAVVTGGEHTLALTSGGTVYAWGENSYGQVGNGSTTDRKTPLALGLTSVVAIAAGTDHSLALRSTGEVYVWGRNGNGQLGLGTTTNALTPQLLVSGAQAIGAGQNHTLVVKTDGTVWATGANTYGQLGDGTTTQRTSLVAVSGISGATAATGGARHSHFLLGNGTLMAVGGNSNGQLGDGTTTGRTLAVAVLNLTGIVALESGLDHVLAADASGALWVWGENGDGQLGDGTTTQRPTPIAVAGLAAVSTFGAGDGHSLAVTADGTVTVWGRNNSSQLGDGATADLWLPTTISEAAYAWRVATPTLSIASGTYTSDRTVVVSTVTSGATIHFTQNGTEPTTADPVVASGSSVIVSSSQTLRAKAWKAGMPTSNGVSHVYEMKVVTPTASPSAGTYTSAQNVTLSTTTPGATVRYTLDGSTPTATSPAYAAPVAVGTSTTVKAVAFKPEWTNSDVRTAIFTMNFGTLAAPTVAPGTGTYEGSVTVSMSAQAGATIRYTTTGSVPNSASPIYTGPVVVTQTKTIRAKAFHPDYATSVESSASYTVAAATPLLSAPSGTYAPNAAVSLTSTDGSTLRITLDGSDPVATSASVPSGTSLLIGGFTLKVRAFRTGTVDSAVASADYTLTVPYGPGAVDAAEHTLLVTPEGALYAWGRNNASQLGDGSVTDRPLPFIMPTLTGVTSVSAGEMHSLALRADGTVWAWGSNASGRLGDGTTTLRNRPIQVPGLMNAVAVAAGAGHSLALMADGTVYAWGVGTSGQLGQGSLTSSSVPVPVTAIGGVVAIAAGAYHSLAITSTGALYAWGGNNASQLGLGTTTTMQTPTLVSGVANVLTVSAGLAHTLAVTRSGAVFVWGDGADGRLGLGTTSDHTTPTLLAGLTGSAVFAGDDHSAGLFSDAVLRAWGKNTAGQVGNGTVVDALSPTTITGPTLVTTLALGERYTVAVDANGGVWTWGAGNYGQLGEGGTTDRYSPAQVWIAPGRWSPPPPVMSLGPATFTSEQIVLITSAVPDAVVRFTTSGMDPVETDPEVPGSGILIEGTTTLKARAWLSGYLPSPVTTGVFVLQPQAPVITPSTGYYVTPPTVTIAVADSAATIRYTIDGSTPTEASPVYTVGFVAGTPMTVRARAFRAGWTPSSIATSSITLTEGYLDAPVADSPSGVYQPTHVVSLSAAPEATIRYTTDGSEPSPTSPVYSTAFSFTTGTTTVKARAYREFWAPSPLLTVTYTMDDASPTIVAQVSPRANSNGWHRTPVTVTFVCKDPNLISCPSPTTVTQDGAGLLVSGTATDGAGHSVSTSVTLNVDLTPPTVTLTSPSESGTTTAATIAVTGVVADTGSGLSYVACNDTSAAVTGDAASCTISLERGRNAVVLTARDAAGNVRSAGVDITRGVTPTALRLSPAARTMLVGETAVLTLTDDAGLPVVEAAWVSSNPGAATISTEPELVVSALGVGTTTVTATKNGLTAATTVTVLAGPSLPDGTLRWRVPPSPTFTLGTPLHARRVDPSVPDLFVTEATGVGTPGEQHRVLGVTSDGAVMWTAVLPGAPLLADEFGGVVSSVWQDGEPNRGLARVAGPAGAAPWRYDSEGSMWGGPAQAPDGTLYVLEWGPESAPAFDREWFLLALNGQSGQVRARAPIPRSIFEHDPERAGGVFPECTVDISSAPSNVTQPVIGADGRGYVQIAHLRRTSWGSCNHGSGGGDKLVDYRLLLLGMDADGATTTQTVFADLFEGSQTRNDNVPYPQQTMPDGLNGMLLTWFTITGAPGYTLTRFSETGERLDTPLGNDDTLSLTAANEHATAYVTAPGITRALDVATLSTLWTSATAGAPLAAGPDRGVIVNTSTGFVRLDGTGQPVATAPALGLFNAVQLGYGLWTGRAPTGELETHVSTPFNEAPVSFAQAGGNRQRANAPRRPTIVTIAPAYILREPPEPYLPQDLEADIRRDPEPRGSANLLFFNTEAATYQAFRREMATAEDAVGFVGHSIIPQDLNESIGLRLIDASVIKFMTPVQFGDTGAPNNFVARIESNAKVIFIGACNVGEIFLSLWGIDESTTDRALIVPVGTDTATDLHAAALAWIQITKSLATRRTVQQAVDDANAILGVSGISAAVLRFRVVGGQNVRIR